MKELLQKLLPSVSFRFKDLFTQKEAFSLETFISLLLLLGMRSYYPVIMLLIPKEAVKLEELHTYPEWTRMLQKSSGAI